MPGNKGDCKVPQTAQQPVKAAANEVETGLESWWEDCKGLLNYSESLFTIVFYDGGRHRVGCLFTPGNGFIF